MNNQSKMHAEAQAIADEAAERRRRTTPVNRDDVQCSVVSLSYNFISRTGYLKMGEGDCCDMSGCISLFAAIDKDVQEIRTFSGDDLDTRYFKSSGNWDSSKS